MPVGGVLVAKVEGGEEEWKLVYHNNQPRGSYQRIKPQVWTNWAWRLMLCG